MIMEACSLKSMSLTKNPDLIPSLKSRAGTYCKRKSSQLLYRHGGISSHVTSKCLNLLHLVLGWF